MNNKVYQGQNFLDKSLEMSGTIEAAFFIALENGRSLTEDLPIGLELISINVKDESIASLFSKYNRPASALSLKDQQLISSENCGIGCMTIGTNFIVTESTSNNCGIGCMKIETTFIVK